MTLTMKMITAIVNKKDAGDVCRALTEEHIQFTKMATTGGFLLTGNTTLLIGAADERSTKFSALSAATARSVWSRCRCRPKWERTAQSFSVNLPRCLSVEQSYLSPMYSIMKKCDTDSGLIQTVV